MRFLLTHALAALLLLSSQSYGRSELKNRLAKAYEFQTISGDIRQTDEFSKFRSFLEENYPNSFRTLKNINIHQADSSLLLKWEGERIDKKSYLFLAHQDVVPISDTKAWSSNPWKLAEKDGFIYARGAIDNKSSLIFLLESIEDLTKAGYSPKNDLYFGLTHDEETFGTGAKAIANWFKTESIELEATLDEGSFIIENALTGLEKPAALIGVAEKGYASYKVTIQAHGGHSSMPPKPSLLVRSLSVVEKIENLSTSSELTPIVRSMLSSLSSEMEFPYNIVFANLGLFEPIIISKLEKNDSSRALLATTITPTLVEAGIKENVLPQKIDITFNARLLPGDSSDTLQKEIEKILKQSELNYTLEKLANSKEASSISSTSSDFYRLVNATITKIDSTIAISPFLTLGMTDSHYLKSVSKNIYRFLPIKVEKQDLSRMHGVDERIQTSNLILAVDFYTSLLEKL